MKLLLDTHVFLWFISGDARLPAVIERKYYRLIQQAIDEQINYTQNKRPAIGKPWNNPRPLGQRGGLGRSSMPSSLWYHAL